MNKTKIEWCDSTWNPVTGCYHECEYCYARRIACRFGDFSTIDGNIVKVTNANTSTPLYEVKHKVKNPYPGKFTPTFHRYRLDEPTRWKKPRNIFVCSMADLFGDWVPDSWIEKVFVACKCAPQNRYLFLTKNPNRYIDLDDRRILPWAENFWFGTTVTRPNEDYTYFENKKYHWFLSIEPMLERFGAMSEERHLPEWIIIGAETGNRKGKVTPKKEWIDDIVDLCDRHNIPLFMKDSLVPIVGEENMRREFPWDK